MRRSPGFTLIELMIVVAIIGLLASIAIPNFLAFQCKSKQAEARASLGSIFSVEKVFLSEHNTYTTDLVSLGWAPDGAPLYLYGWNGLTYPADLSSLSTFDPARNETSLDAVHNGQTLYRTLRMIDLNAAPLLPASLPATACGGQVFAVGAVGDVKPDNTLGLDRWVIDHQRYMNAPTNDCFNLS